jgi:hypothetical protein
MKVTFFGTRGSVPVADAEHGGARPVHFSIR